VIRAHGGSVSGYNQPTGAVFVIDLPVVNSPNTPA
jgi:signal transduction histidine kinase